MSTKEKLPKEPCYILTLELLQHDPILETWAADDRTSKSNRNNSNSDQIRISIYLYMLETILAYKVSCQIESMVVSKKTDQNQYNSCWMIKHCLTDIIILYPIRFGTRNHTISHIKTQILTNPVS